MSSVTGPGVPRSGSVVRASEDLRALDVDKRLKSLK